MNPKEINKPASQIKIMLIAFAFVFFVTIFIFIYLWCNLQTAMLKDDIQILQQKKKKLYLEVQKKRTLIKKHSSLSKLEEFLNKQGDQQKELDIEIITLKLMNLP